MYSQVHVSYKVKDDHPTIHRLKEVSKEDAWISLERGNRIDFAGELQACQDENRGNRCEGIEEESVGRED